MGEWENGRVGVCEPGIVGEWGSGRVGERWTGMLGRFDPSPGFDPSPTSETSPRKDHLENPDLDFWILESRLWPDGLSLFDCIL